MRELRVEDALLYLDQVKVEFGDRPHIYNEFLDIMKTFKTQQIDTPGVIRRVSNLFQGNRRLVLGFNTFLPEGYQIELPEGNGPPVATYRGPGDKVAHIITGPGATYVPLGIPGESTPGSGPPREITTRTQQPDTGAGQPSAAAAAAARGQLGQPHLAQQQPGAPLHQHPHGLAAPQPGHMLGAPGSERSPYAMAQQQQPRQPQQHPVHPSYLHAEQQASHLQQPAQPPMPAQPQPHQAVAAEAPAAQEQPPMEFDHAINYVTTIKKRFAGEPETYKKFLEILHTYQKEQRGIKEVLDEVSVLFADHPDLLKHFTFFLPDAVQDQAKAQLDQVVKEAEARKRAATSKQAIMNQALGMRRAQARGGVTQAPPQQPSPPPPPPVANVMPPSEAHSVHPHPRQQYARAVPPPRIPFGATMPRSEVKDREVARNSVFGTVSFQPTRPPRKEDPSIKEVAMRDGRPSTLPRLPNQPTTAETAFFEKAKAHLTRRELASDKPNLSRRHTPYAEFLKCLHLFGAGILNKDEIILMLRGLFVQGHAPKTGINAGGGANNPSIMEDANDLIREFEEVLVGRGPYANQEMVLKGKSKYGAIRAHEFDFTGCERPTPSYVTYPSDYPHDLFVTNTGQTETDAAVLNTKLISVGSKKRNCQSLEDYDGVRLRCNAYEEAMFKIEDERFEVDMAIERNASAMRQVEPISREVDRLRKTEEKDGQPIGRMQYTLKGRTFKSVQINAIGRIYGDNGDLIIEHLSRNPLAVLPIVYQRLKQKDGEWRKNKVEIAETWRRIQEVNYEGSFDQRCYFRRKQKEAAFMSDVLVEECQDVQSFLNEGKKQMETGAEFALACMDTSALMFQPHLSIYLNPDSMSHYHAIKLIIQQVVNRTTRNQSDRERVGRVWAEFVVPFFDYPPEWVANEVRESYRGKVNNNRVVRFAAGQKVQTAFGEGIIKEYVRGANGSDGRYNVKLSFGDASLLPSAILHGISGDALPKYVRHDGVMVKEDELYKSTNGSADKDRSRHKLDNRFKVLFGSQTVYVFLRLFTMLVSMLDDLKAIANTADVDEDPSEQYYNPLRPPIEPSTSDTETTTAAATTTKSTRLNYDGIMACLKNVVCGTMEFKEYEGFCRRISQQQVHNMASLPKLVEKCAIALVHVAKEDLVLTLHDYGQYTGMDPAQVRSYSLATTKEAVYRIQYDLDDGKLFFSYVPESEDMMTAPPQELAGDDMDMDDDDDSMHVEDEEEDLRAVKRQKQE